MANSNPFFTEAQIRQSIAHEMQYQVLGNGSGTSQWQQNQWQQSQQNWGNLQQPWQSQYTPAINYPQNLTPLQLQEMYKLYQNYNNEEYIEEPKKFKPVPALERFLRRRCHR